MFMHSLLLKNIARFITLTEEETREMISLFEVKELKKKEFLLKEGQVCHHTYFINKGMVRTFYTDHSGIEHNVQFAIEDWWTGDMHSFLTEKPARYNVVAMEDTQLLAIEKKSQEALYIKIPKFEKFFRHLLQNAFVALQERILSSMSETAEERYLNFRKKYPAMDARIPQNQIASFLGITPESLSRVRRQMMRK